MPSEQLVERFHDATTGERVDLVRFRSGEHAGAFCVRWRRDERDQFLVIHSEHTARRFFHSIRRREGRIPIDGRSRFDERRACWEYGPED